MRKDEAGKVVLAVRGHELIDSLPELTQEAGRIYPMANRH